MATASECSDTDETTSVNIFTEMRTELDQKFTEFDNLLKDHKKHLQTKIDNLELEYENKNKQIEINTQILTDLHQQTETKLGDSLVDLQQKMLQQIRNKLQNIHLECKHQKQLRFNLYWNQEDITGIVNSIDLELAPIKVPDPPVSPGKSSENTSLQDDQTDPPYKTNSDYQSAEAPMYYDTYSWNGQYNRKDNRGHRGRYRDRYTYDNNY
ncbi:hypothetical protein LOD99_15805 [Oopsacas minuta]|uniref:Uncharacterized protein n=1 Tax=Oopsacas minuta TaxID=111878 RepID=A0AAV7KAC4_9METZ|nr:hypothetical protein LOD99_15805 [Oopsacas minuta]